MRCFQRGVTLRGKRFVLSVQDILILAAVLATASAGAAGANETTGARQRQRDAIAEKIHGGHFVEAAAIGEELAEDMARRLGPDERGAASLASVLALWAIADAGEPVAVYWLVSTNFRLM